jgi:DNA repair photolyase
MPQAPLSTEEALDLVARLDQKYAPAWDAYTAKERAALAAYFLPHNSQKSVLGPTRPRVVKWYCPFAAQCDFPSGHRYCINVYTGCAHECTYCYATAYSPNHASAKPAFERLIAKDIDDLERFGVPAAPVHISNSTDPFQPLEEQHRHTRVALEQLLLHRRRFTTVTVLTKNPLRPVRLGYLDLLRALGTLPEDHPQRGDFERDGGPGLVIEVSLAFWREDACREYDRCAPSVGERIEGLKALRDAGIPLVLRIDPLFPHTTSTDVAALSFGDFGLIEPQTLDDLDQLVGLARELRVRHVVYSPAKITQPRGRKLSGTMRALRDFYRACVAPEKLDFRGGSWRLPRDVAQHMIVRPFLDLCKRRGVRAKYCKQNLTETP